MLERFEAEESTGTPYRSKELSPDGETAWPALMREAIERGDEETLATSLLESGIAAAGAPAGWNERLALTEFSVWYTAGLAHRLRAEGEDTCRVYRASDPMRAKGSCSRHEDAELSVDDIIYGHRRSYHADPIDRKAISIPAHPNCHHSIQRITDSS